MNPKFRNRLNKIKNKQNQMLNNLERKLKNINLQNTEDFKLYLNLLNQIYFLNKTFDEVEEKINNINLTLKKSKTKNLKKEIKEEKLMQESIDIFKPLIFLHYHLTGSFDNST
tara:strand:+ start:636 stop:974 length:339 start_codon:yes stop_codon:yes gene_type:complete